MSQVNKKVEGVEPPQQVRYSSSRRSLGLGLAISVLCIYLVIFRPEVSKLLKGEENLFQALFGHPRVDWGLLWTTITEINILPLFVSFLFYPLQILVRAWRWSLLVAPAGKLRIMDGFRLHMIGYLMNSILPLKMGEVVRGLLMVRVTTIPVTTAVGTVFVERLVDMVSFLLLIGGTALVFPYPKTLTEIFWGLTFITGVAIWGVIFLTFNKNPYRGWLGRLLGGKLWGRKIRRHIDRFIHGLSSLKETHRFASITLSTIAIYIIAIAQLGFLLMAFHIGSKHPLVGAPLVLALIVIFLIETLGISVPSGPSGLGTYHASVLVALSLFDIPSEVALGTALIGHASIVVFSLLGVIPMWSMGLRWRELVRLPSPTLSNRG
ncbi:MAG: lysylphosphatidylglycerol synthase transmembrane domain-containing protein [bacterium]